MFFVINKVGPFKQIPRTSRDFKKDRRSKFARFAAMNFWYVGEEASQMIQKPKVQI